MIAEWHKGKLRVDVMCALLAGIVTCTCQRSFGVDSPRPTSQYGSAILLHTTKNERSIAAFQQLEVDYYIGTPNQSVHPTDLLETPIVRMYGVTENGETQDVLSLCLSSGHAQHSSAH